MAIFPGLCPEATARAPADDRRGSRRSPADVEKSVDHRQVIWRPPAGDRAVIVNLPAKYGRRCKKLVTLLAPVIPAVVTMLRRREFEAHLAHFNGCGSHCNGVRGRRGEATSQACCTEEMVGETMACEETHIRSLWAVDEWATEREPYRLQDVPPSRARDVLRVGRESITKDSEEYKVSCTVS